MGIGVGQGIAIVVEKMAWPAERGEEVDQHKEKPMANGTRNLSDEDLTRSVLASFEDSTSERFRHVVRRLVRSLHGFAQEAGPTAEEWVMGLDFLTRTGHITDDNRPDFI